LIIVGDDGTERSTVDRSIAASGARFGSRASLVVRGRTVGENGIVSYAGDDEADARECGEDERDEATSYHTAIVTWRRHE
jgi:hypothetical protein